MPAKPGRRHLLPAGVLAACAATLIAASDARAETAGFVWNNDPTAPGTFTPDPLFSYDSTGGAISITHTATGSYTVTFAGLGSGLDSNVEVTGAGLTANFCQSNGWGSSNGIDVTANVVCFTPSGAPADNSFSLMYESRLSTDHVPSQAFVWANQPSTPSYTPSLDYQYLFGGAAITITRNGTGNYTVAIPGLTKVNPSLNITAYGSTPAHCGAQSVKSGNGISGVQINVTCTNTSGTLADTQFDLAYTQNLMPDYSPGASTGGAIEADQAKATAPYVPSPAIQVDGEPMTVRETATGGYDWSMNVEDQWTATNVLAVAVGQIGGYCNVGYWTSTATQTDVHITCFNSAGQRVPMRFFSTFEIAGS